MQSVLDFFAFGGRLRPPYRTAPPATSLQALSPPTRALQSCRLRDGMVVSDCEGEPGIARRHVLR
jgi:hypothetical protein